MDNLIQIQGLTKDYGQSRGIFDVSLSVNEGEVYGLVGINGAGKTTSIRHLMGFLRPQKGKATIRGKDCWKHPGELMQYIGYIPGEISFPDVKHGNDFFKLQAEYWGVRDMRRANKLADMFNLDASAKLKTMSKGMKQKSAIVNAFIADPAIYILDEPTTGLDPLMQITFSKLIQEEKRRGKTVFMSSHMFDELESTCDKVAFLKDGKVIDVVDLHSIQGNEAIKEYKIEFADYNDYLAFLETKFDIIRKKDAYNQVTIHIPDEDVAALFFTLQGMSLRFITQIPYTLEAYFKEKYIKSEAV